MQIPERYCVQSIRIHHHHLYLFPNFKYICNIFNQSVCNVTNVYQAPAHKGIRR